MCATDKLTGEAPAFCPPMLKPNMVKNNKFMQLYRLKQKHNIKSNEGDHLETSSASDWLGNTTALWRRSSERISSLRTRLHDAGITKKLPSSKSVRHLIASILFATLFCMLAIKMQSGRRTEKNGFWGLIYIATFAMHFGAQIWMTMISGLVLYFSLPRHVFGNVQEHLFPAFYTHSSIMSFFMIISFIQIQVQLNMWSRAFVQILCMMFAFAIEIYIRLYVAHPIVMLKHTKAQMEAAAGSGQEIGTHVLGELAKCPHYMKMLRRFRRLHSYTAIGTLVAVSCSIYHMNYLVDRLCI